jgi:hypothetical protein
MAGERERGSLNTTPLRSGRWSVETPKIGPLVETRALKTNLEKVSLLRTGAPVWRTRPPVEVLRFRKNYFRVNPGAPVCRTGALVGAFSQGQLKNSFCINLFCRDVWVDKGVSWPPFEHRDTCKINTLNPFL